MHVHSITLDASVIAGALAAAMLRIGRAVGGVRRGAVGASNALPGERLLAARLR